MKLKIVLHNLRHLFRDNTIKPAPLLSNEAAAQLKAVLATPATPTPKKQPRGHVVKETKRPEYSPVTRRTGGRIVKAMPKQLQKMKQAQEKVEDDA